MAAALALWSGGTTQTAETSSASPANLGAKVEFARDVQPLLREHCVSCHGPDKQKGDLRLDLKARAMAGGSMGPAIVSGSGAKSKLIELVLTENEEERMPRKGRRLTKEEVALLSRWIDQGAVWPEETGIVGRDPALDHWSFQKPVRPQSPHSAETRWPRNPIDDFIAAKLKENNLAPSPEADRVTLIRRLSFDLVGLPPTPEEVRDFVKDDRPDAYERLASRLLGSRQYGERWARHWLDVVRFAETHGFEMNNPRPNAWRYRDYVIAAFNDDKPYDQFVREQLVGDMLGEDAATGFLVAGPWDMVKSPDEVLTKNQRADELHDMVNTTGTAFLGLTLGCARCHDHKFDPIPQRDYYSIKAIFEGVQHGDREIRNQQTKENEARLAWLDGKLRQLEAELEELEPLASAGSSTNATRAAVTARRNLDRFEPVEARFLRFTVLKTNSGEPCLDELEVFSAVDRGTNSSTTTNSINVAAAAHGTKATASGTYAGSEFHKLEHINDGRYGNERSWISNEGGRGWVTLEFPRVERISRVVWSRDRSKEQKFKDRVPTQYRIEVSTDGEGWMAVGSEAGRRPFGSSETESSRSEVAGNTPEATRTRALLEEQKRLAAEIKAMRPAAQVYGGVFKEPEPTKRFYRGDPMMPREVIAPGVLTQIAGTIPVSTLSTNTPEQKRRAALADWMASKENPLTARVMANRLWLHHFGEGLVNTPSDFGRNGAAPANQQLLDWLAAELMTPSAEAGWGVGDGEAKDGRKADGGAAKDWSVKHLHWLIVTSATYRQGSAPNPAAQAVDADARLLWRYPPHRLDAEPIRDAMLSIVGKLDAKSGGPGWSPFEKNENYVRVYVPKATFAEDDFRRMVYSTGVRQRLDGVFGTFDCPDGGQIAPKRTRSTTPLQALNLMNSGFILQMSGFFAERLEREAGHAAAEQVRRAFALAYNRPPEPEELKAAEELIREHGLPLFCRAILNSNELIYVF